MATGTLRPRLSEAVKEVLEMHDLTGAVEVSIALVDDERIRELNRTYRHVDRPTDVLSFGADETDPGADGGAFRAESDRSGTPPPGDSKAEAGGTDGDVPLLLGDIVISLPRAVQQAAEYGHSLEREAAYLAVHGCLHLLGYDHDTDEAKAAMRRREEAALGALGIVR